MKQPCRKNTYRYLYAGRNLLAHLVCLLLIFSMPVLAQQTCNEASFGSPTTPSGQCTVGGGDLRWDSRTLSEWENGTRFELDNSACEIMPNLARDPKFYNGFLLGSTPRLDGGPVHPVGVNPATLQPEAIDLNIFPSIKISDQLSLTPSLSYSEDVCMSRLGRLHYGSPKAWRNHYGELVIMLAGSVTNRTPTDQRVLSNQGPDLSNIPVAPIPSEIQLFFVNAQGQQVNFYPDPAHFSDSNDSAVDVDTPNVDNLRYWYSGEGNYRLEDKNHDSQTPNTFAFELKTPDGLILSFEQYDHDLNHHYESMALRYRVTQIHDRYGNFLDIDYADLDGKDLRPDTVKGYRQDQSGPSSTNVLLHTLDYDYLPDGRLEKVTMPGYGDAQATNTYHFYYPDTGTLHPGMPARHTLNNAATGDISLASPSQNLWRATIPPLKTGIQATFNKHQQGDAANFIFDFDDLGFAPEPMVDFDRLGDFDRDPTDPDIDFEDFVSAGYGFGFTFNGTEKAFSIANSFNRQTKNFKTHFAGSTYLSYRFQRNNNPNNLDSVYVSGPIPGTTFPGTTPNISLDIYPMLKDGDAIVWAEGNQLRSMDVNLMDQDAFDATTFAVKLEGGTPPANPNIIHPRLIREDNRERIAEIQFPTSNGSSHKRMLLQYDDQSVNHEEIKKVQIFDVNATDALLLAETTYTYEHALIQSLDLDMGEVLPTEGVPIRAELFKNCNPNEELGDITIGVGLTGRHELVDMLRRKETRHLKAWHAIGDAVASESYQTRTTHYGGAYRFELMGRGVPEGGPAPPPFDPCGRMEWGLASKPFSFTWQIHSDGTGSVFDLSPQGLGLEPTLAHANRYRRVFKTYRFDHRFQDFFKAGGAFEHYTRFDTKDQLTPFYHYLPSYDLPNPCSTCASPPTMTDLANHPPLPVTTSPTMADLFGGASKCHTANWSTFELVPIYNYAIDTDATHQTRFQRRWTIKALSGQIYTVQTQPQTDDRYFRVAPAKSIFFDNAISNKATAIETFFRGDLCTDIFYNGNHLTLGNPPTPVTLQWTYGGRLDFGSVFHYYHDRQKTHKMLPHSQVTAQKLSGFAWHSSGMVDLEWDNGSSPWLVQATRASNGGYLGLATASTAKQVGDTTLALTGLSNHISIGDVFFHGNSIHSITAKTASTLTFEPSLRKSVSANQTIGFHRFYRGNFANNDPASSHDYHGYDAFGNNAYQAVYKKDNLKLSSTSDEPAYALVPDFFDANIEPFQITLTNSTLPANNDTANWNFFGRVTKQFNGHQLAFTDYSAPAGTERTGWTNGQWMTRSYPGTPYPWTPTQEVTWFRPKDLTTAPSGTTITSPNGFSTSEFEGLSNPTSHDEDRRKEIRYFANNSGNAQENDNTLTHGRPYLTWTVVGVHAASQLDQTQLEIQCFAYDSRGRLDNVANSAFRRENSAWASPYGTRTTYSYDTDGQDSNMDLPTVTTLKSTKAVWDPTNPVLVNRFQVTRSITESSSHVTYDTLGRTLSSESKDGNDVTFGEVMVSSYPTQTKEVTMAEIPGASNPFSTNILYKNGRGQALVSLRQRGHNNPSIFAQINDYDALGRLFRTGFERDMPTASSGDIFAKSARADEGSYTETVFNERGEAFGQVVMRAVDENGVQIVAESSQWTHLSQDSEGHLITQTLRQAPGESLENDGTLPDLDGILVKTSTLDDHGMVAEVRDDRITPATSMTTIWTRTHMDEESDLLPYLPDLNGQPPLAKAAYTYDRWENVKQVDVGNQGTLQTREFAYDQRNRLRREKHPEMRSDGTVAINEVTYGQHNQFDQPALIDHGSGRTWTYDYNPAGDLVQMTTNSGITTNYIYRYDILNTHPNDPALRFPNLPVLIRHDEGPQVAYVNEYHEHRGWLTSRTMFHEYTNFQGFGYVNNLASQDHGDLSSSNFGLEMTYVHDDEQLGRVQEMKYPGILTGEDDPTHLEYDFNDDDQMLVSITDMTFGTPLPLVEDMVYDRIDQLKEATYCQPISPNTTHKMVRTPDTLNRIASWQALWEENTAPKLNETRAYLYDSVGNMAEITRKMGTTPAAPLYRYTYDSLGQIKQAWMKPDPADDADIHSFGYDDHGFGNLINIHRGENTPPPNFNLDLGTNQLSDFNFSPYGEQTSDLRDGMAYTLGYNDLGRLTSYISDPTGDLTQAQYHYDDVGMRVHTATTDAAGEQEERLYFYDDAGMVLCEWVAKPGSNGWEARWESSSIYLEGNTAFTYTYDKAGENPVAQGSSLPQPQILSHGLLTWPETTAPYELEITDDLKQPRAHFRGLKSPSFSLNKHISYGKYHVRMKGHGTTWGDWQTVYFLGPDQADLAGEYGFDTTGRDHSDFKNHSTEAETLGFTHGKYLDSLDMDAGERFVVTNPHAFKTPGDDGTLSVWLKLPPLPNGFVSNDRKQFLDYGFISLWISNHGTLEFKRKGAPYEAASSAIPLDTWAHLSFVYGDGHGELYINGQLALNVANMPPTLPHGNMIFGSLSSATGFEGLIDRLRLFNRGLSTSEIQTEATP